MVIIGLKTSVTDHAMKGAGDLDVLRPPGLIDWCLDSALSNVAGAVFSVFRFSHQNQNLIETGPDCNRL